MSNSLLLVPLYVNIKSNRPAYTYFEDYIELQHVDLIFICRNNMEVKAHKAVLSSVSEFVKQLLIESNQEVVYICLPDVNHRSMKLLLNYLYSGVTKVKEAELLELKDILSLLQISLPCASVTQLKPHPQLLAGTQQEKLTTAETSAVSFPGKRNIPSLSNKRKPTYSKNDRKMKRLSKEENILSDTVEILNGETVTTSSYNSHASSSVQGITSDPLDIGGTNSGAFNNDKICVIKLEDTEDGAGIKSVEGESEISKLNPKEENILPILEPVISMIGPDPDDCAAVAEDEMQEVGEDSDLILSDDVDNGEEKIQACTGCQAMSIKVNQEISAKEESGEYKYIRIHPPDIYGIPQYECVMCSQTFATLRSIRYHIWRSHSIVTDHCRYCHKSFKSGRSFKRHKCNNESTETLETLIESNN